MRDFIFCIDDKLTVIITSIENKMKRTGFIVVEVILAVMDNAGGIWAKSGG